MTQKTVSFQIADISTIEVRCPKCATSIAISLRAAIVARKTMSRGLYDGKRLCICGQPLWTIDGGTHPVPEFIGALVQACADEHLGLPGVMDMSSLRLTIDQK